MDSTEDKIIAYLKESSESWRKEFLALRTDLIKVIFNDYQIANLKAAFEAMGYGTWEKGRSPLDVLHTGDWVGEIYQMLPNVEQRPNIFPEDSKKQAREWKEV